MSQETGVQDNVAGAAAYLVLPAIFFLVQEPYKSKPFLRFHSFQALFVWAVALVFAVFLNILAVVMPMVVAMLWPVLSLVSLAIFVVAVICAVKAFGNESFKLPVIGDLAEKQAASS